MASPMRARAAWMLANVTDSKSVLLMKRKRVKIWGERKCHQPRLRVVACGCCLLLNLVDQAPFPARAMELLIRMEGRDTRAVMTGKKLALAAMVCMTLI
jgi:hypothetical protein